METRTYQERYRRAARRITGAYLWIVCCLLPLVFWRMYFDITEAKLAFFLGTSLLYLFSLLLARLFCPLDYGLKPEKLRLPFPALALALLALCCCVGSALGGRTGDAFWGQNNRYQGIFTLLVYAAVVFALAQQTIDPRLPARALAIGAVPVCLLGALHHFGIDPLGFFRNLGARDMGRFLSTIGNADFYGSYLCIAVPVVLDRFLQAEHRRSRVLYSLALSVVFLGALVAGSDSTALGLLAAALLFPLALFSDLRGLRRYLFALALFALCSLAFGLLSRLLPSVTYLSSVTLFVAAWPISGALFAAAVLLWLASRRWSAERVRRWRKPYGVTLAALVLLGAVALVLLNTLFSDVPLGNAAKYLRFSPGWGTDRGKIWLFAARLYGSYSPAQMLFGAGPGALFHADAVHRVFHDAALDTAHNEYLQYLLVSGALGLAAYLAALAGALTAGVRSLSRNAALRGLIIALAAYAAQATVNIAQPMSTPLAMLIIGILISRAPTPDSPHLFETKPE